jgi:cell division protein FtsW (lipid II flippase)
MEPLAVASDLEAAVCLVERQAMRTVMMMIFRLPARILGTRIATTVGLIWILLTELLIIVVQCFKSRHNVKRWLAAGEGACVMHMHSFWCRIVGQLNTLNQQGKG